MTTSTPNSISVTNILQILQIALAALAVIPATAPEAALGSALIQIIQKAMAAYQGATGQPLDLTKIPIESTVP